MRLRSCLFRFTASSEMPWYKHYLAASTEHAIYQNCDAVKSTFPACIGDCSSAASTAAHIMSQNLCTSIACAADGTNEVRASACRCSIRDASKRQMCSFLQPAPSAHDQPFSAPILAARVSAPHLGHITVLVPPALVPHVTDCLPTASMRITQSKVRPILAGRVMCPSARSASACI